MREKSPEDSRETVNQPESRWVAVSIYKNATYTLVEMVGEEGRGPGLAENATFCTLRVDATFGK